MKSYLSAGLLAAFALIGYGCKNGPVDSHLTGFSDYLEGLGYSFHNPPRSDLGPGTVFRLVENASGAKSFSPVCKALFPDIEATRASISIPTESRSSTIAAGVSLGILSDLLETGAADAQFDKDVEITFTPTGQIYSEYFYEEDAFNAAGESRTISPQCFARLRSLSSQGGIAETVLFIQDAVRVDGVAYSANSTVSTEAGVDFVRKLVGSLKPSVLYDSTSANTLVIAEPRYIAFKAFKINEFVDTGLTGPGSAVVKMQKFSLDNGT